MPSGRRYANPSVGSSIAGTMDRLKRLELFHGCHNARRQIDRRPIVGHRSEILYDVLINPLKSTDWWLSAIRNTLTNQLPVSVFTSFGVVVM